MAADYFDSYRRAQLMALLSQVGPRPVSSRDAAVQVNPRRDASVQCSLGRRTLQHGRRRPSPEVQPGSRQPSSPSGARRPARSWRTIAVYSPVGFGGLASSLEVTQTPTKEERRPVPAGTRDPDQGEVAEMKTAPQSSSEESDVQPEGQAERKQPTPEDSESVAETQLELKSLALRPVAETAQDPSDPAAAGEGTSPQSTEQDKERLRFQVRPDGRDVSRVGGTLQG